MGIRVKLPIVVQVDNMGAIFMSGNIAISNRTKHVDIQYHFVRKFVEDNFLKIIFVKTKENVADIFTKNLPKKLHNKHRKNFLQEKKN